MKSCVTISLVPEARGGPFVFWDDLAAGCRKAGELGFDAVEVFAPGPEAVDRALLRRLLDEHSLQLAAVGTGAGWVRHRLHLALADAAARRRARDFLRAMIDFGGAFGAPAIIGSMQGRSGDGVDRAAARGHLADALEELGQHAAAHRVPLLFEPINRYETDQVSSVADGVALLRGLSTRNVRLLCDLFHMNIEEEDVAGSLRAAGDLLGHVHFVDSNRRPVGCGHLDMRPVAAALREMKYGGYLSAEALPYPDSDAAARQTIGAFRYWLGRQGLPA
jgi:sugar phosphate isomerase/epimerase